LADEPSSSVSNVGGITSQPSATCQSRLFGKMTANFLSISPAFHFSRLLFFQESFVSKPEQIRCYFLDEASGMEEKWTVSLATREAVDQLVIFSPLFCPVLLLILLFFLMF
jgi:hypothetical protein